jgi:hypothetical protein
VIALIVDHREIFLFGTTSVEVWYDAGTPDFPLARSSRRIYGSGLRGCVFGGKARQQRVLARLGCLEVEGIVYRANGYTPARISTNAVEYAIQSYGNISDAVAYTYQQDGHPFYVLIFPSADATWVYDVSTQLWHERAGFENGQFVRHRSNCQMSFNSEVVVGDYEDGRLYAFDLDVYADDDQIQKWLRSWRALPTGQNNLKRTAHHSLQLDAETGVGLNDGQGSDPQVMLRWSDDAGHTWSNEHWNSMGQLGAYGTRTIWRRLGMTEKIRDRVYEVSGTDPVKIAIMGAELFVTPTSS